jgi:hypothetical protein
MSRGTQTKESLMPINSTTSGSNFGASSLSPQNAYGFFTFDGHILFLIEENHSDIIDTCIMFRDRTFLPHSYKEVIQYSGSPEQSSHNQHKMLRK